MGGDEREQEIARLAAVTGADVRAFGLPWPAAGIHGVSLAASAAEAFRGAKFALFPIPGLAGDGSLFAPAAAAPIVPNASLLRELVPGAHVILGMSDERLRAEAVKTGVQLHEYESDRELMLLRVPAIAEGAIALAIEHTVETLHSSDVAVVGYGNVGGQVARTLLALGARVHVFARNPVQRAAAYAAGATAEPLERLAELAPLMIAIFSSVPSRVVERDILERLPRGTVVIDLAAPPGSVDLVLAEELGHRAIWARGLGRRAPVTVGRSQWQGIRRVIDAIEQAAV